MFMLSRAAYSVTHQETFAHKVLNTPAILSEIWMYILYNQLDVAIRSIECDPCN